ncbi:MAG TPA: hypothetical protein VGJ14_03530 [Sporichthyaceae bacterium]
MNLPPRSVPDVAEQLMREFESVCSVSLVTEIVMRLSRNGAVSLPALAELARRELAALAGPPQPVSEFGCAP